MWYYCNSQNVFFILDGPIISFNWNNSSDFLTFNFHTLELNLGGKIHKVSLANMVSIKLESKKKLAPLIFGAVITSLALVNILLEGAGLSMIGFLSIGLLILYFGMSDYWVITIEQFSKSNAHWISKNKCPTFPQTLINIIDYRVSKGYFPPFYTVVDSELYNSISINDRVKNNKEPFKYHLIPPRLAPGHMLLKVDIAGLNQRLQYVEGEDYLVIGTSEINKDALINNEA